MLRRRPGVFVAGEMLDWEAPTGGYLLQAWFATGVAAGNGALDWLQRAIVRTCASAIPTVIPVLDRPGSSHPQAPEQAE